LHIELPTKGMAESFFSTLKNAMKFDRVFTSREHAKLEEIFYNRQRLHQALDYITPEAMELGVVS